MNPLLSTGPCRRGLLGLAYDLLNGFMPALVLPIRPLGGFVGSAKVAFRLDALVVVPVWPLLLEDEGDESLSEMTLRPEGASAILVRVTWPWDATKYGL